MTSSIPSDVKNNGDPTAVMAQRIMQVVKRHLEGEKARAARLAELRAARKEHAATVLLPALQTLFLAERAYQIALRTDSQYDAAIGELLPKE